MPTKLKDFTKNVYRDPYHNLIFKPLVENPFYIFKLFRPRSEVKFINFIPVKQATMHTGNILCHISFDLNQIVSCDNLFETSQRDYSNEWHIVGIGSNKKVSRQTAELLQ